MDRMHWMFSLAAAGAARAYAQTSASAATTGSTISATEPLRQSVSGSENRCIAQAITGSALSLARATANTPGAASSRTRPSAARPASAPMPSRPASPAADSGAFWEADGSIPIEQLSAWLMATWIRGLSLDETRAAIGSAETTCAMFVDGEISSSM